MSLSPLLLVLLAAFGLSTGIQRSFCHLETLNLTCANLTSLLVIERAYYGRIEVGRCQKEDLGYLGCHNDVTSYIARRCSGRRRCNFPVVDLSKQEKFRECSSDVTSFIKLTYRCQKVLTGPARECRSNRFVPLTRPSGYLASLWSSELGQGTQGCPWYIKARQGQTVNLTLLNFATGSAAGSAHAHAACNELATVSDATSRKHVIGCVTDPTEKVAYVSHGSALKIYVHPRVATSAPFMLHYQVTGCADPILPAGSVLVRSGLVSSVKCNSSHLAWKLTCRNSTWDGPLGNCSHAKGSASSSTNSYFRTEGAFPYGILIVVSIGVALGVFFGGLLLFSVNVYLKSRNYSNGRPCSESPSPQAPPLPVLVAGEPQYCLEAKQHLPECEYSSTSGSGGHSGDACRIQDELSSQHLGDTCRLQDELHHSGDTCRTRNELPPQQTGDTCRRLKQIALPGGGPVSRMHLYECPQNGQIVKITGPQHVH